jgi:hypothetical protein
MRFCRAESLGSQILALGLLFSACGSQEAPAPWRSTSGAQAASAETQTSSSSKSKETPKIEPIKQETTPKSSSESMSSSPPSPMPAPQKAAIRTVASPKEVSEMQTLYAAPANQGGCASCHGALATSAKKGRTAVQIQQAQTIFPHRNVAAAMKWPRDLPDATDDGTDAAQLLASAMAEALK